MPCSRNKPHITSPQAFYCCLYFLYIDSLLLHFLILFLWETVVLSFLYTALMGAVNVLRKAPREVKELEEKRTTLEERHQLLVEELAYTYILAQPLPPACLDHKLAGKVRGWAWF